MPTITSYSVGNGDTYTIWHGSDNFTIIDCHLLNDRREEILSAMKIESNDKGITRFISTHPDQDHIAGIEHLDQAMPITNFYVVKNNAVKLERTDSFVKYCGLRDSDRAFYIEKNISRKWMNQSDDQRKSSGLNILWPEVNNPSFQEALRLAEAGISFNNISCVVRYKVQDGLSALWLGDLEKEFMKEIFDFIELSQTDIVFAPHHGRKSGKIPDIWLEYLEPKIIVIGEAPTRDLDYYTGYSTLTQNRCGDIKMVNDDGFVHIFVGNSHYEMRKWLTNLARTDFPNYIGSLRL